MRDRSFRPFPTNSCRPAAMLGLLVLLASCAAPASERHYEKAVTALRNANFRDAYRHSQSALEDAPEDRKIQRFAERMRVVAILDEARTRIFEGKEREGLNLLARVLTFHPENQTAKTWQRKAKDQLASRLLDKGQEWSADDLPEPALEAFQEVLTLQPGNVIALRGLQDVRAIYDERRERADNHFRNALLARQLVDWPRTLYHAEATTATDPTHKQAKRIEGSAARQVARERRNWADTLASEQRWGAAGRELLEAIRLAENAKGDAKIDWIDEAKATAKVYLDEAQAAEHVAEAEVRIAGGKFDAAREQIAKAEKLSKFSLVYLNELRGTLAAAELDSRYVEAKFNELAYQFDEALGIYTDLAISDPDGLAASKVLGLTQLLKTVVELFEKGRKAEEAGQTEDAISAYRRVLSLHPLYEDTAARVARLGAALKGSKL